MELGYYDFRTGAAIRAKHLGVAEEGLAAIVHSHEGIHHELARSTRFGLLQIFLRDIADSVPPEHVFFERIQDCFSHTIRASILTHEAVAIHNSLAMTWRTYPSDAQIMLKCLTGMHLEAVEMISPLFVLPPAVLDDEFHLAAACSALLAIGQVALSETNFLFAPSAESAEGALLVPRLDGAEPDHAFARLLRCIDPRDFADWVAREATKLRRIRADDVPDADLQGFLDRKFFTSFRSDILKVPSSMDDYNDELAKYGHQLIASWNQGIGRDLGIPTNFSFRVTSRPSHRDLSRFSSPFFEATECGHGTTPSPGSDYPNADPTQMAALVGEIKASQCQALCTVMINPSDQPLPLSRSSSGAPLPPRSLLVLTMPFSLEQLRPTDLPRMGCRFDIKDLPFVRKVFTQVETAWRFHSLMYQVFSNHYGGHADLEGRTMVLYQAAFPDSLRAVLVQHDHEKVLDLYTIRAQSPNMFFVVFHVPKTRLFHIFSCTSEQLREIRPKWSRTHLRPVSPDHRDMLWLTVVGTYTWIFGG